MFATRGRTIVTTAVLLEVGIAGWALGHAALWLLVATAAITLADTVWGVIRRRCLADLAGIEVAATLGMLVLLRADAELSILLGAACLAWLIRPERQPAAAQPTGAA
jgi:hypothetical protein